MTENEKELLVAIEHLKARNMSAKHIDMAIQSLEKQSMVNELLHECKELENELEQYRAIGTIEEFKTLKEKSMAKKQVSDVGGCIYNNVERDWDFCK